MYTLINVTLKIRMKINTTKVAQCAIIGKGIQGRTNNIFFFKFI